MNGTVVVGAGIAGLTAALMAREAGCKVTVVSLGFGGLQLSAGTLDVLGVPEPLAEMPALDASHPYAKITPEALSAGVEAFTRYVPMEGSLASTTLLPTALGALRPTSFYPPSFAAGRIEKGASYLIVGFTGLKDFYPRLAAENLASQGVDARAETVELTAPGDTSLPFSRMLDQPGAAEGLGERLAHIARPGERIGIPAVARSGVWEAIQRTAGHPVFQIPIAPPSIPGLEANELLREACAGNRVDIMLNGRAIGLRTEEDPLGLRSAGGGLPEDVRTPDGATSDSALPAGTRASDGRRITGVEVRIAGSVKTVDADHVIYAGGGLDSGAIVFDSYGNLADTAFGLPVFAPEGELVHGDVWGPPQPLFAAGLRVDADMRPVDGRGAPLYTNLYAVGGMLGGAQRHREKSGEGIALGSAAQAVCAIERTL